MLYSTPHFQIQAAGDFLVCSPERIIGDQKYNMRYFDIRKNMFKMWAVKTN
jgi:hypothetical protein